MRTKAVCQLFSRHEVEADGEKNTPNKSPPLSCILVSRASCQCDVVGDEFCAITVGEPFVYVIPGFSVLSVELRQVRSQMDSV